MGRRSKKDKPVRMIRAVLARNVAVLRDQKFGRLATVTARNRRLAQEADTTLSQVQRILDPDKLGTSIDSVEILAEVFGVRPHELLTPYQFARKDAPQPTVHADGGEAPLHRRPG